MAIPCECPACFEPQRLEDTAAGQTVRCGVCRHTFRAPGTPVPTAELAEVPVPPGPPKIRRAAPPAERPRAEPVAPKRRKEKPAERDRPAPRRRRPAPENRDTTGIWLIVGSAVALLVAGGIIAGYFVYTASPRAAEHAPVAGDQNPPAGPAEQRKLEQMRQAADAERARWDRLRQEEETKQREHPALLEKLRNEFRTAGRQAPDPYAIPGLVFHLGFDGADPWPKSAGQLFIPDGTFRGPGPRGDALYVNSTGWVKLGSPSDWVKVGAAESVTVSGWVKLRFRPVTLLQVEGAKKTLGHVTVSGRRVVLGAGSGPEAAEETAGTRASATWDHDDQWHHVAAVRDRRPDGERAVVHLDASRSSTP